MQNPFSSSSMSKTKNDRICYKKTSQQVHPGLLGQGQASLRVNKFFCPPALFKRGRRGCSQNRKRFRLLFVDFDTKKSALLRPHTGFELRVTKVKCFTLEKFRTNVQCNPDAEFESK